MTAIALTIAGSDSGGCAGIQADLKTFSALGVYGASVITAVTAQNTVGVQGIHDIPADIVAQQIESVLGDLAVGAVKVGMVSRPETIEAVAAGLERRAVSQVVLDPVMVAASGGRLLALDAVEVLRAVMLPRALLVTPNLPEAASLLDEPVAEEEPAVRRQAERILALGPGAVLIKGGHGTGSESVDILVDQDGMRRFPAPRIATRNTHGTGCTLSSAIAAGLAKGRLLDEAITAAKSFVSAAIAASDQLHVGHGHGPVHHFHAVWR